MSLRLVSTFLVLVLAAALAFDVAGVASAEEPPSDEATAKASARFQKGVELYNAGDVRAALIEFRRAYTLAPNYRLLFNIGQASAELNDYVEAYKSFTQYLADGADQLSPARRELVEREIARLTTYLARLTVTVSVEGAEVTIDGVVVGVSPLGEPVLVSAGRRRVVVTRAGHARWERFVDLAGEDDVPLEVELISLAAPAPNPTPATTVSKDRADRSPGMGAAFWTSAALTTALAIGTGASFALTLRAKSDHDDELAKVPNTQAAIDDAADKVDRMALVTDIGLGLTAVGAVATIVFAIRGNSSPRRDESVGVLVSPTGVGVVGRF